MDLPIASYDDPSSSSARLLNCYIEKGGEQGRGPVLQGVPGIETFKNVGEGPIRAAHSMNGIKYVVSGNKLYSVRTAVTQLGTVPLGARPQIADNGIELCIVVEPDAYVYTPSTGVFAEITDADFTSRGAASVQFIDNFFSFTEPNSGRWFISDLAAGTVFDPLDFATAEGAPDDLVTHIVDHRQAILLGKESFEIWDNAGVSGFPFIRASNGFGEIGCLAGQTAAKLDQSVCWLANDFTVRKLQGITPVRISTHSIEKRFRTYTVSEAYAITMTWDGHLWYVLTFPEATWIYDATTQQWFERASYAYPNWRASCALSLDGETFIGDSDSNKFGKLADVFTEWENVLRMEWTHPAIHGNGERALHSRLEIMTEAGVGITTGQGSDPEISLQVSDDGKVFRHFPTKKLGKIGQFKKRAVWFKLGQSRYRVYRPSISDPVRRKVVATNVIAEGGAL